MRKTLFILFVFFFTSNYFIKVHAQTQEILYDTVFEFNTIQAKGEYVFFASNRISFTEGFVANTTPAMGYPKPKYRYSRTDFEDLPGNPSNVNYVQNPLNPLTRELNTNLPVGSTQNTVNVFNGAAVFTMPIFTPPGTASQVPSINISYNSYAKNALLGLGFDIGGLSEIIRAGKDYFTDRNASGINYDENDVFYLDGKRLFYNDKAGNISTYLCKEEPFTEITSYDYNDPALGPKWFQVKTKSGLTLLYGASDYSRITLSAFDKKVVRWRLYKVTDQNGNFIEYIYNNHSAVGGESYIKEIRYTGNLFSNTAPFARIKFFYGERDDQTTAFYGTHVAPSTKLLTEIHVVAENTVVKKYKFSYFYDNIISRLYEIEELNNEDLSFCNSTLINWANSNYDTPTNASVADFQNYQRLFSGDFNNDGWTDVVGLNQIFDETECSFVLDFFVSDKDGSFTLIDNLQFEESTFFDLNFIDIDNDGINEIFIEKTDTCILSEFMGYHNINDYLLTTDSILWYPSISSEILCYKFINNEIVFQSNPNYNFSINENTVNSQIHIFPSVLKPTDFDGNGAIELLICSNNYDVNDLSHEVSITYNFDIEKLPKSTGNYPIAPLLLDFNGNGKTDIIYSTALGYVVIEYNANPAIDDFEVIAQLTQFPNFSVNSVAADFNGDGLDDVIQGNNIFYSNGTDFLPTDLGYECPSCTTQQGGPLTTDYLLGYIPVDINKDGKLDLLAIYQTNYQSVGSVEILYSSGMGTGNYLWTLLTTGVQFHVDILYNKSNSLTESLFYCLAGQDGKPQKISLGNETYNLLFNDFNADGIIDVLNTPTESAIPQLYLLNENNEDFLVKGIVDGYNNYTSFDYVYLTHDIDYTLETNNVFPNLSLTGPLTVAKQLNQPDGIGGIYSVTYDYHNGIINRHGLGFLGYDKLTETNSINKVIKTFDNNFVTDNNKYHYFKTPSLIEVFGNDDTKLSETEYTFDYMLSNGSKSLFYYIETEVATDYMYGIVKSNQYTYNSNGNMTEKESSESLYGQQADFTQIDEMTYTNYQTWFVPNRVSTITTTSTRTGETPYSATVNFAYNNRGTMTSMTKNSGTANEVTVSNSIINLFGLTEEVKITSAGLPERKTINTFDSKGRFLISATDAEGHTASQTYEPAFGNMLSQTNAQNLTTEYTYNSFGVLTDIEFPDGIETSIEIDWDDAEFYNADALYKITKTTTNAPQEVSWYDLLGRPVFSSVESFGNNPSCTANEYNAYGQLYRTSEPHYFNIENPKWSVNTYDIYGRLLTETFGALNSKSVSYSFGSPEVSITMPDGLTTTKVMNASGLVTEIEDAGGNTLNYSYNSTNLLNTVELNSNLVITNTYDAYGRLTATDDINMGTYEYTYNKYDEMIELIDNNKISHYEYDKIGRLTKSFFINPNEFEYVTTGNGKGNIYTALSEDNILTTFSYDNLGRVASITENIIDDQKEFETIFEYNQYGKLSKITYPSGVEVDNSYNSKGYQSSNYIDSDLIATLLTTNAKMQPCTLTYGNTIGKIYEWDSYNNIEKISIGSQSTLQEFEYEINPNTGNLNWRADNINNFKETFAYDNFKRLTSFNIYDKNQAPPSLLNTVEMAYSNTGNIETKTDIGFFNYDATQPGAVSSIEIDNTDIIVPEEQNITYTWFNKIQTIEQLNENEEMVRTEFKYGADRQRRVMYTYVDDVLVKTTYFAGLYEQTITDGGATTTHYNYINTVDGLSAVLINNGQREDLYYINKDHLGSITALIDESGSMVAEYSYDPWGRQRKPTDWLGYTTPNFDIITRGYTGHEHLPFPNLINMNGRVYDPITARFLSPDPFVQNPTFSQDYNRYTYVNNNPMRFTDPSGYNYAGAGNRAFASLSMQLANEHGEWNNMFDKMYNRGLWAAQGAGGGYFGAYSGFSGMTTFYFKNGKLYTIADDGNIITTNDKDKGTRAFYKNGEYGFYAQVSGTVIFNTLNGYTTGWSLSDVVCQWVAVGSELPAWNDVGWRHYGESGNIAKENSNSIHTFLHNNLPHWNILSSSDREAVTGISASFAVAAVAALPEPPIALGLGIISFGLQSFAYADVVFDYASNPNPSPTDHANFWYSTVTFGLGAFGLYKPVYGTFGSGMDVYVHIKP